MYGVLKKPFLPMGSIGSWCYNQHFPIQKVP